MPTQTVTKVETLLTDLPNGVEVEFSPGPHTYRLRKDGGEWIEDVWGVTTALDALAKGGLTWWGMKIGEQAILTLWDRGKIRRTVEGRLAIFGQNGWEFATVDNVTALMTREKLTVNHVRDEAGDRGQEVHDALEEWLKTGTLPVPEFYINPDGSPSDAQGYIRGLIKFLTDVGKPKSKPMSEVIIASYEHRFAGRYDMEMVLHDARLCVALPTPAWTGAETDHHSAKGPEYEVFNGRTVFDLKTPKGVYASHHLQLELYEGARLEIGWPKSEQRIVIRVTADGNYLAVKSVATYEDALHVLAVARAVKRIEKEARAK